MSEMVERVAKAIYEDRNGPKCYPWGSRTKSHRAPYLADARAAIEAMRDLNVSMILKATGGGVKRQSNGEFWRAVIDSALSQPIKAGDRE